MNVRTRLVNDIHNERVRQEVIHPEKLTISERYVTLGEEIGEVAMAIQSKNKDNLVAELVQVAAVSVRMAEQVIKGDELDT